MKIPEHTIMIDLTVLYCTETIKKPRRLVYRWVIDKEFSSISEQRTVYLDEDSF